MSIRTCLTPFGKQCFVATGACVNIAGTTMLLAYPSGMMLQLKRPDSEIPIDMSIESWIAAMPTISSLLGSFFAAMSISRFGRRMTQIASIVSLLIGWLIIDIANGVTVILIGRFFHGLAMGSCLYLTPIIFGEYSSPRHRGTFMMCAGVLSAVNVLLIQNTGLYLHWRTNAIICTATACVSLPSAIYSPESPSWLATRQRYDDCRRAFRWLRGDDEEEELTNMIKASEIAHRLKSESTEANIRTPIREKLIEMKSLMMQKEFYKPILIMAHVYTSGQWAGSNLLNTYVFDLIGNIIDKSYNDHVLYLNLNRVLCAILSIYLITRTKRRTLFLALSGSNVGILFITAAYTYAKSKDVLPFDSPVIGLAFLHLHTFFITVCCLPMPYIIAGEIFPLKYKSIAGGFSIILNSLSTCVYMKSFPYLLSSLYVHGAYTLYGCIVTYCLLIAYIYLPETKDRTLQEIEDEITGKPLSLNELKTLINKNGNQETHN